MKGKPSYMNKQNQSSQNQRRRLISQTTHTRVLSAETDFLMRYEEVERILVEQNYNLKEQNCFLLGQIRKIAKREKNQKIQLQMANYHTSLQQEYISKLEEDFFQFKNFVQDNILKIMLVFQSNSLEQLKSFIGTFLDGLAKILCLQLKRQILIKKQKPQQKYNKLHSFGINQQFKQLKFHLQTPNRQKSDLLVEKYQRIDCLDIDKVTKQLIDMKKTPQFSIAKNEVQLSTFSSNNNLKELSNLQKTRSQVQDQQGIIKIYQNAKSKNFTQSISQNGLRESKQTNQLQKRFFSFKNN